MPKLSFEGTSQKYRGSLKSIPWCLCLGAGISSGLVPSWKELTRRVLARSFAEDLNETDFDALVATTGWTLESWLQTALNRTLESACTVEDFSNLLESELYSDLLENANSHGLADPLRRAFNNPLRLTRGETVGLWEFFVSSYPNASITSLSKVLVRCLAKETLPKAILNFNAETIFQTVYTLRHVLDTSESRGRWEFPKQTFHRVYRAEVLRDAGVPIYHLHGCILPPTGKRNDSRERLVFPESDYSELAGSVFSWAQTTFLHFAQSHRLVFIGHSLADPNVRKWLSWATTARAEDLRCLKGIDINPLPHVVFMRRPFSEQHGEILENSLLHLGIQICWLESWDNLEAALNNLFALVPTL